MNKEDLETYQVQLQQVETALATPGKTQNVN